MSIWFAIFLMFILAVGIAEGQTTVQDQLPIATQDPSGTAIPITTTTNTLTATPTAIVATLQTTVTSQTASIPTEAGTIPSTKLALTSSIPMPSQLICGPRVLPWRYPTPELRYIFPVQPPEIASYGAAHHDYPATDIFAPLRSIFVAVTSGVIDELSYEDFWDPAIDDPALRSGSYVTIIGDDGVRYHGSHLDELVPGLVGGDRVVAGQILGYVGNSGNARGIAHHLHFGISYPTFAGDWEIRRGVLSPYPYLQAWTRHEVLTPDLSQVIPQ